MVEVDQALTRSVAHLARLELSDSELELFTSQLKDILKYVDQLQNVDVKRDGCEIVPLVHPIELEAPFREDLSRNFEKTPEGHPKVIESAPDVLNDGYKVPPIL